MRQWLRTKFQICYNKVMENTSSVCPYCSLPVPFESYFCPNCGKQIRQKMISVSIAKQIGVYLLSFLLPPLGLYPGIKYIRKGDIKTKIVGCVAVILTLISIILTFYLFANFMQQYSKTLDQISSGQFQGY